LKDPDLAISWLLRIGVLLSAGLIMVGMIVHLIGGSGRVIIVAGLLVLIATPVARVVFSIFIFMREGDRLYVAITSTVLLILLFGFAVGATGAETTPLIRPSGTFSPQAGRRISTSSHRVPSPRASGERVVPLSGTG
jgi:uncharacterized membrane protein